MLFFLSDHGVTSRSSWVPGVVTSGGWTVVAYGGTPLGFFRLAVLAFGEQEVHAVGISTWCVLAGLVGLNGIDSPDGSRELSWSPCWRESEPLHQDRLFWKG